MLLLPRLAELKDKLSLLRDSLDDDELEEEDDELLLPDVDPVVVVVPGVGGFGGVGGVIVPQHGLSRAYNSTDSVLLINRPYHHWAMSIPLSTIAAMLEELELELCPDEEEDDELLESLPFPNSSGGPLVTGQGMIA